MTSRVRRSRSAAASRSKLGRPRDPDVDRALLDAALTELSLNGFSGMSVDGVAARSGVGRPSIYRRYPDKTALAIAALADLVAHEDPPAHGDLQTDLIRQLEAANSNLQRCGSVPLLGTLLAESERRPQMIDTYRRRLLEPRAAKIMARLAAARDRREIAADADLTAATLLLLGFLTASYIAKRPISQKALRAAVATVVEGLSPRSRP